MLKNYLKQNNISIYTLAKKSEMPYSTVNDIVNHKGNVKNCKAGGIWQISKTLGISMEIFMEICEPINTTKSSDKNYDITVYDINNYYYAEFNYKNKNIIIPLCVHNQRTEPFINVIAQWLTDDYILEKRMEEYKYAVHIDA